MLSEKECLSKKSKNGSHRFYPTTGIEPAEIEYFVYRWLCPSGPLFLLDTKVWAVLRNHVIFVASMCSFDSACVDANWSRAGLMSFADTKQMRKGQVSLEITVYFTIVLTKQSRCQEKPVGIKKGFKYVNLIWQGRDVLNIFMTWILKCIVHHV